MSPVAPAVPDAVSSVFAVPCLPGAPHAAQRFAPPWMARWAYEEEELVGGDSDSDEEAQPPQEMLLLHKLMQDMNPMDVDAVPSEPAAPDICSGYSFPASWGLSAESLP